MSKNILVVEDDPDIRYALELVLSDAGYNVKPLATPEPILAGQIERPDMLIVDVTLPVVDGLTLCQVLRAKEDTKHVPIVVISAAKGVGSKVRECGANDFLEKPFAVTDLIQTVQKYLQDTF